MKISLPIPALPFVILLANPVLGQNLPVVSAMVKVCISDNAYIKLKTWDDGRQELSFQTYQTTSSADDLEKLPTNNGFSLHKALIYPNTFLKLKTESGAVIWKKTGGTGHTANSVEQPTALQEKKGISLLYKGQNITLSEDQCVVKKIATDLKVPIRIETAEEWGSGFFIRWQNDVLLLTASHVLKGNQPLKVKAEQRDLGSFSIVYDDVENDIVVLRSETDLMNLNDLAYDLTNNPNFLSLLQWDMVSDSLTVMSSSEKFTGLSFIPDKTDQDRIYLWGITPHGTSGSAIINEDGSLVGLYQGYEYGSLLGYGLSTKKILETLQNQSLEKRFFWNNHRRSFKTRSEIWLEAPEGSLQAIGPVVGGGRADGGGNSIENALSLNIVGLARWKELRKINSFLLLPTQPYANHLELISENQMNEIPTSGFVSSCRFEEIVQRLASGASHESLDILHSALDFKAKIVPFNLEWQGTSFELYRPSDNRPGILKGNRTPNYQANFRYLEDNTIVWTVNLDPGVKIELKIDPSGARAQIRKLNKDLIFTPVTSSSFTNVITAADGRSFLSFRIFSPEICSGSGPISHLRLQMMYYEISEDKKVNGLWVFEN